MTSSVSIDDVAQHLGITQRGGVVDGLLTRALDATIEAIALRLGPWVPDPWPANVEQAVVLGAARLYKRRNSPEGVSGFGDLGVVRVTSWDPDIEALLNPDLAFHFGGAAPVIEEPVR